MISPFFRFKALFLSLLAISLISVTPKGFCVELKPKISQVCFSEALFEVKTGYFFFSNSKMRKVYDNGGFDIQLCGSSTLWNQTGRWNLNAYGTVEYFQRSGKSVNGHQKTSIWSVPVNIGLKPVYAINSNIQYYFAVGPRYFYLHQHNSSSYVDKNRSRNGLGFFLNTGFNYSLCKRFVFDVFGQYSYGKIHLHPGKSRVYSRDLQVGGFTYGGGFGYEY